MSDPIIQPPTVPPVAVILLVEIVPVNEPDEALMVPEMSTPVAVSAPVLVTLNGAVDAVEPPSHNL